MRFAGLDVLVFEADGSALRRAVRLTNGVPTRLVATIREPTEQKVREIVDAGVNHLIFAITDAALVKALMGRDLDNVASVNEQLQLIHDEVMPAFK